jgi:hypothetical protein
VFTAADDLSLPEPVDETILARNHENLVNVGPELPLAD